MRIHPTFIIALAVLVASLVGCRTSGGLATDPWPTVRALPDHPPADLDRAAPTTQLRRGSDGFVYVVGGLPNKVATGASFVGRYSGEWPLQDMPRPPLVSGRVLKRFDRELALVMLNYTLPGTELDGLEVTFEEKVPAVGKGLSAVSRLKPQQTSDIALNIGEDAGVLPGDIYGIFEPAGVVDEAQSLQLARRLLGICLVDGVGEEEVTCRLWRGSSMVPGKRPIAVGDRAIFLEHTYGRAPRESVIQVAQVRGAQTDVEQKLLREAMALYLQSLPNPNASVELIDGAFDASAPDFHRETEDVKYQGRAQVVVGGAIVKRGGKSHLVVNYTGVGPAVGPGMVAAPPEGGIDLGPLDNLSADDLRAFASIVWSGVLVYRGQTSEALMHLHLALSDRTVRGPARWHARDQYAMRWAVLDFVGHALWLVLEDEAVAAKRDDQRALLNALGTRVRLYDMLSLPTRALAASQTYLDGRAQEDPTASGRLGAMGMHAEMLVSAGKLDAARDLIAQLEKTCPQGCDGNLSNALAAVYMATPDDASDMREGLLQNIVSLAQDGPRTAMASARTYQGLNALSNDEFEDALIAFLEAERLYTSANDPAGIARIKYFMFITQMSRQEPQEAFDLAIDAIERVRDLGDFDSAARTYELLANLYTNFDARQAPGPWLGAAREVLDASVQAQLARGDFGKTASALLGYGAFLVRINEIGQGQNVLRRGVLFAIRATRFDVAALCHLWLGIGARAANDRQTFVDEIERARLMGAISGDPEVVDAIERVLNPEEQPDTPTPLL